MTTALAQFLQLHDRSGQPILAKANEVRSISIESHHQGDGPGRVIVKRFTRIDFVEGGWYLVQERAGGISCRNRWRRS